MPSKSHGQLALAFWTIRRVGNWRSNARRWFASCQEVVRGADGLDPERIQVSNQITIGGARVPCRRGVREVLQERSHRPSQDCMVGLVRNSFVTGDTLRHVNLTAPAKVTARSGREFSAAA